MSWWGSTIICGRSWTGLRDMISQVAAGSLDVATARSEINKLTMRQNQWTVGAYCESYCRLVGLHHTIESTQLFPGLAAGPSAAWRR